AAAAIPISGSATEPGGMIGKLAAAVAIAAVAAGGTFFVGTMPQRLDPAAIAAVEGSGDAQAGRILFFAGGCSSCHSAEKASGEDRLLLGGGRQMVTEFGTFVVPNISQHPADGIGRWSF